MGIYTKHMNIRLFDEYGLAIIYQPRWSIYLLIGFVSINIYFE